MNLHDVQTLTPFLAYMSNRFPRHTWDTANVNSASQLPFLDADGIRRFLTPSDIAYWSRCMDAAIREGGWQP